VPSHDDVPVAARARSPRLVRALLVGACATGLTGLALTGGGPAAASRVSAVAEVRSTLLTESIVAEPHVIPDRSLPRLHAPVASRSRRLVAHKRPAKKRAVAPAVRWVRPSGAGVVSPYGMRWGRMHKGIDFGASYGAPIYAIGDGVVVGTGYQGSESGYGQITIIRHQDGFYSAYAHQSRMVVSSGDTVHAGELIGYVGATGEVTGTHLHFEIRTAPHGGQINPTTWLREHGVFV
jgi:murein DD-endopeptidase MepM/ murein hydrolase activator NlpD